jgi:hypothetical protein
MFLYEFAGPDPLTVKLIAVTNQLKSSIDQGQGKTDWTTDEFLAYLQDQGINIDSSDLYDMIKNPPLSKIISNIQADKIIFKGQAEGTEANPDEDQSQQVVQQMAKSAMK